MAKLEDSTPEKFLVILKGHRITGLAETIDSGTEEGEEIIHLSRPVRMHWRPRDFAGRLEDRWLSAAEIKEQGFDKPEKNWPKRKRPVRSGLRANLYEGCVIEAASSFEAQAKYQQQFGVLDTKLTLWDVKSVSAATSLGPWNPPKA